MDWRSARVVDYAGTQGMLVRSLDPRGGAAILDLATASTMVVAARYHDDAAFLRAARQGSLYVAVGVDGEATVWQARAQLSAGGAERPAAKVTS
jgi:hypothetical protein